MVLVVILLIIPKEIGHLRIDSFHNPHRKLNYRHKIDGDTSYQLDRFSIELI
jgi:hypothetical protein